MSEKYKEIINSAIHYYLEDDTELEMEVKDYLFDEHVKAGAFKHIKREYEDKLKFTKSLFEQSSPLQYQEQTLKEYVLGSVALPYIEDETP